MDVQVAGKMECIISFVCRRMKELYDMYIKTRLYLTDVYKGETVQRFASPADKMLSYYQ